MIVSKPCFGCLIRKDCDLRRSVVTALRGLPVRAAAINCDIPFTRHFPPGTRVKIRVWDWSDEEDPGAKMVAATVIMESSKRRGKLLCYLDEEISLRNENKTRFMTGWPKDVERLDETRREICKLCGLPLAGDRCVREDCSSVAAA